MRAKLAEQAMNGEANPLEAYITLKALVKDLEADLEAIKDLAFDEAAKYPEKSFKAFGAIIEKKSAPSTWDYSQVAELENAKKRVAYVQQIAQSGGGFDTDGVEIGKAIKIEGKSIISIKLLDNDSL